MKYSLLFVYFSGMRAKSMNMDEVMLRGSKTFNPRRVQSTFVRSPSSTNDNDEESTESAKLAPFPGTTEVYSEHF